MHCPTASTCANPGLLEEQVAATDAEIDQLVSELYELTPEEVAIVEKG